MSNAFVPGTCTTWRPLPFRLLHYFVEPSNVVHLVDESQPWRCFVGSPPFANDSSCWYFGVPDDTACVLVSRPFIWDCITQFSKNRHCILLLVERISLVQQCWTPLDVIVVAYCMMSELWRKSFGAELTMLWFSMVIMTSESTHFADQTHTFLMLVF